MLAKKPNRTASPRELDRRRSRLLRRAFLVLLGVALAQVMWWMIDQTRLMNSVEEDLVNAMNAEVSAAERLLDSGTPVPEVDALLPSIAIEEGSISTAQREAEIEEMRRAHLNQYRWEGGFFLAVLLIGMVVLARAMSREVELRYRQENFLAAVTHELKSPLASLRLALQTMERRDLDPVQQRRLIDRNLADLDRLDGLIGNVLESSRLDSSAATAASRERIVLAQLSDQVVAALAKIEQTGCDVVDEIPRDLALEADPNGVLTVMRNLIDNAVEAASASDEPVVKLTAGTDADGVWLEVEDNGHGFDPAEADRLFTKFYRPGDELTRQRSGSGLGLYLVRRFVELEGGFVTAESQGRGHGARFRVRWPSPQGARR